RRHTMSKRDWSSDVCSSDLQPAYWRKCGQVEVTAAARWRVAGQANLTALQFCQFTVSRCCSFNGYRTRLRSIYPVVGCEFDILRSEERRVGRGWKERMWGTK